MSVSRKGDLRPVERNRLRDFMTKLLRYLALLKWLFTDSVWRFKRHSILLLLGGFLGVTSEIAAIGQVIYYLRLLQEDQSIVAFGHTFEPRSSLTIFVLFAVVVFFSLLLSSWLIYLSRKKINTLRRKYEEFCSRRALLTFSQNLRWSAFGEAFCTDRTILQSVRRDSNYCGRMLQMVLEGIIPSITVLAAVGVLVHTHTLLTLLILGMMTVSMSLQYGVNKRGAEMSLLMEKTVGEATSEKREIIDRLRGLSVAPLDGGGWMDRHFSGGATKRNLDAAQARRMATDKSKLISDVLFAVILCLILLTLGVRTFIDHKDWTSLVVYLVALRLCFTNFRTVMSKMTAINRFYPQFSRYYRFVDGTVSGTKKPGGDMGVTTIHAAPNAIQGSMQAFRVKGNHLIGLVSPVELNRYTISFLTGCMMWSSPDRTASALDSMGFVTSKYGCLPGSIRESLGLPEGYGWKDITQVLDDVGLLGQLKEQVPENLEGLCTPKVWHSVDAHLKFVLGLIAVSREDDQWVMLDGERLRFFTLETQEKLLGLLGGRIRVIVYSRDISQAGKYSHDVIAVIGSFQRNIVGLGTQEWFLTHEKEIEKKVRTEPVSSANNPLDDLEEEYEEEEM